MARLAAVNSATPFLQAAWMRSRVEQARREADQAQAYAEDLRQQLDLQEQVTAQAQGRVRNLVRGANVSASPSTPSEPVAPTSVSQSTTVPSTGEPTYLNTLAAVFKVAQPILAMSLSSQQKDVVKSSLVIATNARWSNQATGTSVARSYANQTGVAQPATSGQLLNQTV